MSTKHEPSHGKATKVEPGFKKPGDTEHHPPAHPKHEPAPEPEPVGEAAEAKRPAEAIGGPPFKPPWKCAKGSSMPGPRPEHLPKPLEEVEDGTVVGIHWPEKFGMNSPREATTDGDGGFKWKDKGDEAFKIPPHVEVYGPLTAEERAAIMEDGEDVWAEKA